MILDITNSIQHGEVWGFLEAGETDIACRIASEVRRIGKKLNLQDCGLILSEHAFIPQELKPYLPNKLYAVDIQAIESPEFVAEVLLPVLQKHRPTFLLLSSSGFGAEVGARLAAKLEVGLCAGVVDLELKEGRVLARKPIFGGKAQALLGWRSSTPFIVVMDSSALDAIPAESAIEPEIIIEYVGSQPQKTEFGGKWKVGREALDVREAEVVIGVGNGIEREEFMEQIKSLAELLEATVGGSRIARYRGLVPEERQIGISGRQISALIYLALGISGAPYHLMGIRDVKHIAAVNCDKTARIFKNCEFGIIADLHEVVPKLIELIRSDK